MFGVQAMAQDALELENHMIDTSGLTLSEKCEGEPQWVCNRASRLQAHKPNSIAWEFTDEDDNSLEANYSFRYLLTRPDCSVEIGGEQAKCLKDWPTRNEWFLSYTGKFDFYMGTRDSGPVVNRVSNPALHWRIHNPSLMKGIDWINIALEHRSNGQVTEFDIKDASGNYVAEQRWLAGDRAYIDSISRGANYFSFEMKNSFKSKTTKYGYWLSAKAYFTEDSLVTWGDKKGSDHRIWDYDVARFVFVGNKVKGENKKFKQFEYSFEYTLGAKGFATDSLEASIYFPYVYGKRTYFPINYLKIHVGPMSELSNYTEPQASIYLGLKLNPFPEY